MATLTPRQEEILNWLRDRLETTGVPPTRAEIAQALGFRSANAAETHLQALARKGAIELVPGTSRGIRLKDLGLPVVGRVAAGHPILASANIERHYQLDPSLFRPQADYLLRVQGLSMRDAGILEGDLIAVHRTPEARDGDIVVARLDDEVTVKRLQRKGGALRLLPANPDFTPIDVDPARHAFALEGIAVGLVREGKLT